MRHIHWHVVRVHRAYLRVAADSIAIVGNAVICEVARLVAIWLVVEVQVLLLLLHSLHASSKCIDVLFLRWKLVGLVIAK